MIAGDRGPAPLGGSDRSGWRHPRRCARCGAELPARDFREALARFGLAACDEPLLTCLCLEEN